MMLKSVLTLLVVPVLAFLMLVWVQRSERLELELPWLASLPPQPEVPRSGYGWSNMLIPLDAVQFTDGTALLPLAICSAERPILPRGRGRALVLAMQRM